MDKRHYNCSSRSSRQRDAIELPSLSSTPSPHSHFSIPCLLAVRQSHYTRNSLTEGRGRSSIQISLANDLEVLGRLIDGRQIHPTYPVLRPNLQCADQTPGPARTDPDLAPPRHRRRLRRSHRPRRLVGQRAAAADECSAKVAGGAPPNKKAPSLFRRAK